MASNFTYPQHGALRRYVGDRDFLDGQCVPLPRSAPDAADLAIATFFALPGWVKLLLGLRNALVRPLRLKTGTAEDIRPPTRQEILDCRYPGIFAVHSATPDEVILGSDDRHLDFRVSVLRSVPENYVAISTWVRPHTAFGRFYLASVYPFHRVIVATCLANASRLDRAA